MSTRYFLRDPRISIYSFSTLFVIVILWSFSSTVFNCDSDQTCWDCLLPWFRFLFSFVHTTGGRNGCSRRMWSTSSNVGIVVIVAAVVHVTVSQLVLAHKLHRTWTHKHFYTQLIERYFDDIDNTFLDTWVNSHLFYLPCSNSTSLLYVFKSIRILSNGISLVS